MKTPLQNLYLEKLAALNDQLCFFLFNREEFNQKIGNFSANANTLFTTDLFVKNAYASKIHVTFEKLPEFQQKNQTLNFGAYFSFSYEFFAGYIDDASMLIQTINGSTLSASEQKKDIETKFKILISKAGLGIPDEKYFDTLTYCRLRRNYFTHILQSLNSKFLDVVNNKGTALNTFWVSAKTELDFTQHNVEEFKELETIELIKILRITLEEIDSFIATTLNKEGVAKYIATETYSAKPTRINADIITQRKRKIDALAKKLFGLNLTDSEMHEAASTIGKR